MKFFVDILFSVVLILSPLLLYLFYVAYNKNLNVKTNNLYFNIVLLTIYYLEIKYFENSANIMIYSISIIPLILSFIRKDFISTCILMILQLFTFNINVYTLILMFVIIILYYLIFKIKYFALFCFSINLLFILINNVSSNILEILFSVISGMIIYKFIILLMKNGEKILDYHTSLKELQKEKQLHDSIFKIAHEIKNPIAVCKGYFDMMNINDEVQVKKYLPIIKEEIDHTLLILQDFSSMNKIKIDKELMDINLLVEDTIESFKPIFKHNNITIKTNLLDDEVYINGDYNRLKQVLINVIKNSLEAMNKEGKIDVNTYIKNDEFVITIADNGIGMNEDVLQHFMDPFYTTKKNGTGLGICLSKEILNKHYASIFYNSKENVGTEVDIFIPIKKNA